MGSFAHGFDFLFQFYMQIFNIEGDLWLYLDGMECIFL